MEAALGKHCALLMATARPEYVQASGMGQMVAVPAQGHPGSGDAPSKVPLVQH